MNGGISIHTYFLELYLRGELDLQIMRPRHLREKSLEMELICNGLTSMQNKLKHHLLDSGIAVSTESCEPGSVEIPDEDAATCIALSSEVCIKRAGSESSQEVKDAIAKHITEDYAVSSGNKVIFCPRVEEDSNDLMASAIQEAAKELFPDLVLDDARQRYIRRLLTQKSRKQSNTRQDLIRAAYRLRMDLNQMNGFLTKSAFTYALDLTDPWELAAAYLTVYHPVKPTDAPMVFDIRMRELNFDSTDSPLYPFLSLAMASALDTWIEEWSSAQAKGKGSLFLMDWAWDLFVYSSKEPVRRTSFSAKKKLAETGKVLSSIYAQLEALVLSPRQDRNRLLTSGPAQFYTENLGLCLLDPRFQVLQQFYRSAADVNLRFDSDEDSQKKSKKILFPIYNCHNHFVDHYYPAFRDSGFHTLSRNLRKVEDRQRPLSRSDILSLCIELEQDWDSIDRHLKAGGFGKLYVKDIHEKALAMALMKNDDANASLKEQILIHLESLYASLSQELQKKLKSAEPEWIGALTNQPEGPDAK